MIYSMKAGGAVARLLWLRRATGVSVLVCSTLFWPAILAQPADPTREREPHTERFAMGKKITNFERSRRFETVTFYKTDPIGGAPATVLPSKAVPFAVPQNIGRIVIIPSLERFGVVLIQLAPNVEPDAVLSVVGAYNDPKQAGRRQIAFAGSQDGGNPIYSAGNVDNLLVNEVIVRFKKGTDPQAIAALFKALSAEIIRAPAHIDRAPYLVRFPGASGHEARVISNRLDALDQVEYSQPNFVGIDPKRVQSAGQTGATACFDAPDTCVLKLCPDPVSTVATGDPFYVRQWHLDNPGTIGKEHADINAKKAWEITRGGPTVIIAVLDDLVETTHEDLTSKIKAPWNAFTEDGSSSSLLWTDSDCHGTAAAGIAAAATDNEMGVAGIAAKVMIMPVRTFDPTFPHYIIQRGIMHAADHADVLSMSWTLGWAEVYPDGLPAIEEALQYAAIDKARVLVFAAGNDQGKEASYPASRTAQYPIIAVSATDEWDTLKKIKNPLDRCEWGTSEGADTVAAPGIDLYTTDRMGSKGYCTGGTTANYARFSGTSAAVPLVAGTAALMLSAAPSLKDNPVEVRRRLQQSAFHPNPGSRPNDQTGWGLGWGRIDACRALQGTDCDRDSPDSGPP